MADGNRNLSPVQFGANAGKPDHVDDEGNLDIDKLSLADPADRAKIVAWQNSDD